MLLRKSPGRTPALLTANRGNEQKSIRPRTQEGKNRVGPSPSRFERLDSKPECAQLSII
jgi:hypothetical protein